MIKFFRRIRQNLIMENKTSKYLKYAIGEIVLVVIGILIALQVNNWNENRKIENGQTVFLANLKEDLENDLDQMNRILTYQSQKLENVKTLEQELKNPSNKNFEDIEQLFAKTQTAGNDTFFANTGTYSSSVSSGTLANTKPESLKIAITNLYERYYYRLIYNGELYDNRVDEVALHRGNFYNQITQKLNNLEVLNESEFQNLVSIVLYYNTSYVNLAISTKTETQKVIDLINKSLAIEND